MAWAYPNELYAIIRCTKIKFANSLVDRGTVMFNCAKAWADIEKKKGKGQGDVYEGVFAVCHHSDIDSILSYNRQYDDVESECNGKLVYFRRKSVMQMPAFCFFMLKQSLFDCSGKEGIQTISTIIPGTYFQDFADGMQLDQIMLLSEEERPSLVIISDMDKFIEMIKKKLISIGVRESEILVKAIQYEDKHTPFYNPAGSPKELFLKDKSFSYQAEGRVVVNTRNRLLIDALVQKPIDIGSLKEFSKQSNTYFEQGILIKMKADVYSVDNEGK